MGLKGYGRYKDSGIEWLGKVPEHWEIKRLRFVCELNPSKSEISCLDKDTPVSFLPMEAIGDNGLLDLDREKMIHEVETGYTFFRNGDVTIAKITPCFENGKGALMQKLLNGIGFGTTELIVARPKSDVISGQYMHWLFVSSLFRKFGESHIYGAGQKRVPDDFVRNFAIGIPPLEEQSMLSAYLDRETTKIDTLITEKQRLIDLLKEKRQALISHAVTKGLDPDAPMKDSGVEWLGEVPEHWAVLPLKRNFRLLWNKTDTKNNPIALENIESWTGRFISSDSEFAGEGVAFDAEDVLFGKLRPYLAKGYVADSSGEAIGDFFVMRPMGHMHARFALYQILSQERISILDGSTYGAKMPRLDWEFMASLEFLAPPLFEQKAIAAYLDSETTKIDSLIADCNKAIDLLKEKRSALISAVVTGKVDVRHLVEAI